MARERVLHVIESGGLYGAERVLLTLLAELRRMNVLCVLGCLVETAVQMPELAHQAEKLGIRVEGFVIKHGFNLGILRQLREFIRTHSIQLIHSHGYKANILCGLLLREHIRKVSTVHGWLRTYGLRVRVWRSLEVSALKHMDRVVAVSQAEADRLRERGLN